MPTPSPWSEAADGLTEALSLTTPPIAITFSQTTPDGVSPFDAPMPEPTPDGRTGRVPAGCVFWTKALDRTFSTVAADHGNCSVGSLTHGFATFDEVAGHSDMAALVELGWVTMDRSSYPRYCRSALGRDLLVTCGNNRGSGRCHDPSQRQAAYGAA